jgi:hypothetical protein
MGGKPNQKVPPKSSYYVYKKGKQKNEKPTGFGFFLCSMVKLPPDKYKQIKKRLKKAIWKK